MPTEKTAFIRQLHDARARRNSARAFGVDRMKRLAKPRRKRVAEVASLFDAVMERCKLSEREVFERAYPFERDRAHRLFWVFVRDMSSCPQQVTDCAEQLLTEVHNVQLRQ